MTATITTTQELFDTVAGHLLRQAKKSMDSKRCLYRSKDGLKCAVGCLLTDAVYSEFMEGTNVRDIVDVLNASVGRDLTPEELDLLSGLQGVHDGCPVFRWPSELKNVADVHQLHYPFSVDDEKACLGTAHKVAGA